MILILASQVSTGGDTQGNTETTTVSHAAQISVVYTFVTNVFIYTGNWIKSESALFKSSGACSEIIYLAVFLAIGLLYLNFTPSERWAEQRTTFRSSPLLTIFWLASLIFVVAAPFIPNKFLKLIPFYVVPTLGTGMLAIGTVYWLFWAKVLPILGFDIQHEIVQMPDGSERVKYKVRKALEGRRRRLPEC